MNHLTSRHTYVFLLDENLQGIGEKLYEDAFEDTLTPIFTILSHHPSWSVWLLNTFQQWVLCCSQKLDSTTDVVVHIQWCPPPHTAHPHSLPLCMGLNNISDIHLWISSLVLSIKESVESWWRPRLWKAYRFLWMTLTGKDFKSFP